MLGVILAFPSLGFLLGLHLEQSQWPQPNAQGPCVQARKGIHPSA